MAAGRGEHINQPEFADGNDLSYQFDTAEDNDALFCRVGCCLSAEFGDLRSQPFLLYWVTTERQERNN